MNDKIKNRLKDMPMSCRNNYKMAISGRSRKAAVKAFCLECMGWERTEVHNCNTITCPLHPYKPYK